MRLLLQAVYTISLCTIFSFGQLHAQSPGQSYQIQSGDWLSKIAATSYDNPHQYYRIIEGTNEKALLDKSYQRIGSANQLQVGQKIWIPALKTSSFSSTSTSTSDTQLVTLPKTDCEIRIWYNYQVIAISKLNERWEDENISLEERAKKAYELRHNARVNARFMMQDKSAVKMLQERDMAKYNNPDGPTFTQLLQKNIDKGLSTSEAYDNIIKSSSRVSTVYNSQCVN